MALTSFTSSALASQWRSFLASGGGHRGPCAQGLRRCTGAVLLSDGDSGRLPDGTSFRLTMFRFPSEPAAGSNRGGAKCESGTQCQGYEAKGSFRRT